jgi:hypothetical protein
MVSWTGPHPAYPLLPDDTAGILALYGTSNMRTHLDISVSNSWYKPAEVIFKGAYADLFDALEQAQDALRAGEEGKNAVQVDNCRISSRGDGWTGKLTGVGAFCGVNSKTGLAYAKVSEKVSAARSPHQGLPQASPRGSPARAEKPDTPRTYSLPRGNRLRHPFGLHRQLSQDREGIGDAGIRGGRNQNLTAGGVRFDAAREVHRTTHHPVLGALLRADIAHYLTGVNVNAHLNFRQVFLPQEPISAFSSASSSSRDGWGVTGPVDISRSPFPTRVRVVEADVRCCASAAEAEWGWGNRSSDTRHVPLSHR